MSTSVHLFCVRQKSKEKCNAIAESTDGDCRVWFTKWRRNAGLRHIKKRLCQKNCALHLTCPVVCNDYSVWVSFTDEKLTELRGGSQKLKYNYPHQLIVSMIAGIVSTRCISCFPGNSQPQLRVSTGRAMLLPPSRDEAVPLLHWLFWYGPKHPPNRPIQLLTSLTLMPLSNVQKNFGTML